MGNQHVVHAKAKIAAQKFDSDEIFVLEKLFTEMSERNNGKGQKCNCHHYTSSSSSCRSYRCHYILLLLFI